jgi:hypothetical protein
MARPTPTQAEVLFKMGSSNALVTTFAGRLASSAAALARRGLVALISDGRRTSDGKRVVEVEMTETGLDVAIELLDQYTSVLDLISNYGR